LPPTSKYRSGEASTSVDQDPPASPMRSIFFLTEWWGAANWAGAVMRWPGDLALLVIGLYRIKRSLYKNA